MRLMPHCTNHQTHSGEVHTILINTHRPQHSTQYSKSARQKLNLKNHTIFKYYNPYKQIVKHKQETGTQRSSNNNWL